ncbi:hypothetical protein HY991_01200 [Candidatus Micrarchaeota archaeon]|nr:hypothetical protein [Candidatus Micrarchaeota archaeon]
MGLEGHYLKQKKHTRVRFQVDLLDATKITSAQFTIFDFINNSFTFSHPKKQLTISLLENLKQQPQTFGELLTNLNTSKSTLYLLCLALERAGMIFKDEQTKKYKLDAAFTETLNKYGSWWETWLKT